MNLQALTNAIAIAASKAVKHAMAVLHQVSLTTTKLQLDKLSIWWTRRLLILLKQQVRKVQIHHFLPCVLGINPTSTLPASV